MESTSTSVEPEGGKSLNSIQGSSCENVRNTEEMNDMIEKLRLKQDILKKISEQNADLIKENEMIKQEKTKLEKEKDEALSRLSKLAGQKLTTGNPTITDLSNPNRPAKIGEGWASLYTDEWTDAYEDISHKINENAEGVPEKELMKIVNFCYRKCLELKENQEKEIKEMLWKVVLQIHFLGSESSTPVTNKHINCRRADSENKVLLETMELLLRQAMDERNKSVSLVGAAQEKCSHDYKISNPAALPSELKFVQKCSELCWFICSSDPPMVIEYDNFVTKIIDANKFNKYNRTGTIVEYVVWPVLLLHKDGEVLAKGTVQTQQVAAKRRNKDPKANETKTNQVEGLILTNQDENPNSVNEVFQLNKEQRDNNVGIKDLVDNESMSLKITSQTNREQENMHVENNQDDSFASNSRSTEYEEKIKSSTNANDYLNENFEIISEQDLEGYSESDNKSPKTSLNFKGTVNGQDVSGWSGSSMAPVRQSPKQSSPSNKEIAQKFENTANPRSKTDVDINVGKNLKEIYSPTNENKGTDDKILPEYQRSLDHKITFKNNNKNKIV